MIARESFILNLLEGNEKYFFIPVYQREYSWTKENCEMLMKDIYYAIQNKLDSHFFGSIVYTSKELAGTTSYCIIDGQQRITTIYLLLKAICNEVLSSKEKNEDENGEQIISIDSIKNSYFFIDPYRRNPDLRLILTDDDNRIFRELFLKNNLDISTKIGRNYSYFTKEIKGKSLAEIRSIYSIIRKLAIVNVSLELKDDPQRIFESLNSKILPLEESDKIRNYIFMNVDYEDQKILYADYWKNISANVSDISKLVRYYLAIKTNNFIPEKQLYFLFKDYMVDHPELTSKQILEDILKYSKYMKDITSCSKDSKYPYERCLYRLNKLDMSTIYPLVFICLDSLVQNKESNGQLDIDDMNQIMQLVESYIARRNFLGLSTASLNKVFAYLPGEVFKLVNNGYTMKDAIISSLCNKSAGSRFPKDAEFKNNFPLYQLYNAKPAFRKYVLERLENYNHKELIDVDNDLAKGHLTIEHIMPQTLDEHWKNYLGERYEIIHQTYIDTIGNLTLTAYNSEYSNLPFIKKRDYPDLGFASSNLYLNNFVKKQDEWKEEQIKERANILLNRAVEIWPYPTISAEDETTFDIHNPNTWKNVKITQLGRDGFNYLLAHNLLTSEEVTTLKTKEGSKELLGAYYPVLSNSRDKSETGKTHWAKAKYIYNGEELYLTYEWFVEQYDLLSIFLKKKIVL